MSLTTQFEEYLEHLIRRILQETFETLMENTITDLNIAIADATQAASALSAAAASSSSGGTQDFTQQVTAVKAVTTQVQAATAKIGGTATGTGTGTGSGSGSGTGTTSGAILASPSTLALSASNTTQTITLTGAAAPVSAISSQPNVATVTPASGNGPFTVTLVPGATGSTTISFTDTANNAVSVPVTADAPGTGSGTGTGTGTGTSEGTPTVVAIPATVNLSATVPTISLAATQSNATAGTYTGVMANPNVATVSPASGSTGVFTLTRLQPGTTTLLITDEGGLNVTVPIISA